MFETRDDVVRQLTAIHKAYATNLPQELERIEEAWRTAVRGGTTGSAYTRLVELVHGLAGSGATFGFSALSDAARVLLVMLTGLQSTEGPLTRELRMQIERLLEQLVAASREATESAPPFACLFSDL